MSAVPLTARLALLTPAAACRVEGLCWFGLLGSHSTEIQTAPCGRGESCHTCQFVHVRHVFFQVRKFGIQFSLPPHPGSGQAGASYRHSPFLVRALVPRSRADLHAPRRLTAFPARCVNEQRDAVGTLTLRAFFSAVCLAICRRGTTQDVRDAVRATRTSRLLQWR